MSLGGQKDRVFGYANDPTAEVCCNRDTREVIIAYRGTDPGLFAGETKAEKADHALTTLQDIAVDAKMVRDTVNTQKAAADAFTEQMIAKAAAQRIPKSQVFATAHSLGSAHAEIEAAKYGFCGSTYSGFGAADLIDGPPQPRCKLTNYRMAGDVVSAASPHIVRWCRWPVRTICGAVPTSHARPAVPRTTWASAWRRRRARPARMGPSLSPGAAGGA